LWRPGTKSFSATNAYGGPSCPFIYESCIRDAKKALDIAEKSSASRLAAQAGV
ncbi:hypothetical protein EDB84DRAFT_1538506, partial [Lactarius hengduanensis]